MLWQGVHTKKGDILMFRNSSKGVSSQGDILMFWNSPQRGHSKFLQMVQPAWGYYDVSAQSTKGHNKFWHYDVLKMVDKGIQRRYYVRTHGDIVSLNGLQRVLRVISIWNLLIRWWWTISGMTRGAEKIQEVFYLMKLWVYETKINSLVWLAIEDKDKLLKLNVNHEFPKKPDSCI